MHSASFSVSRFLCSALKSVSYCCEFGVQKLGDSLGRSLNVYTLSTNHNNFVVNRAIFVHKLNTGFCYLSAAYSQAFCLFVLPCVSTFSTMPINTTN
jgi:hypothetical protein